MRYSLGRFQSLAVCLWTRLSRNRPSAHDVPSYLEGPSVGHMALSLGYGPSAGSGPVAETKTPSSVAFIHKVFLPFFSPKSVSSSVQTELNQQLHTPDAPSIGPGTFCWTGGQQAKVSCFSEIVHHNRLPAFSEPPSPVWPHTLWLLCLVRCSGRSLGIFTLLLFLSTVQTENNT